MRMLLALLAFNFVAVRASAQVYPSYQIAIVVPLAPGGATDVLPRMVSVWNGFWMPKGTPQRGDLQAQCRGREYLAEPELRRRLIDLAHEGPPREQQTPGALGALQKAEIENVGPSSGPLTSRRNEGARDGTACASRGLRAFRGSKSSCARKSPQYVYSDGGRDQKPIDEPRRRRLTNRAVGVAPLCGSAMPRVPSVFATASNVDGIG